MTITLFIFLMLKNVESKNRCLHVNLLQLQHQPLIKWTFFLKWILPSPSTDLIQRKLNLSRVFFLEHSWMFYSNIAFRFDKVLNIMACCLVITSLCLLIHQVKIASYKINSIFFILSKKKNYQSQSDYLFR